MPKCDFNKVPLHIFRTPFLKKTPGRLFLNFDIYSVRVFIFGPTGQELKR